MTDDVTVERAEGWGGDLKAFISMTDRLFARPEPRVNFADFIGCLLSDVPRKNGWQIAAHAGRVSPDRQQKLLAEAAWSADALRDLVREQVVTHLGAEQAGGHAVLVVDETAALKKGTRASGCPTRMRGSPGRSSVVRPW